MERCSTCSVQYILLFSIVHCFVNFSVSLKGIGNYQDLRTASIFKVFSAEQCVHIHFSSSSSSTVVFPL